MVLHYPLPTFSNILDQWILARLDEVGREMTAAFENYEIDKAVRPIGEFVEDLSTWYLRRSRDRFKGTGETDKQSALATTRFVLLQFAKLMAPIAPFFAEYLFDNVKGLNDLPSVHLEKWPEVSLKVGKLGSLEVLEEMAEVRKVVSLGLEARAKAGLKVRQPLARLTFDVHGSKIKDKAELLILIADEVNVKEVVWGETGHDVVELDTKLTPELKEEGNVRDFVRAVQDLRKQKNLNPSDTKNLSVATSSAGQTFLKKYEQEVTSATNTKLNLVPLVEGGAEVVVESLTFKIDI